MSWYDPRDWDVKGAGKDAWNFLEQNPIPGLGLPYAWDKLNPGDPYKDLSKKQGDIAAKGRKLAEDQRGYIEQGGAEAQKYYDKAQGAYDAAYGPGGFVSNEIPQLQGPTDLESRYKSEAAADAPGYTEQLYAARAADRNGYDPYSKMLLQAGNQNINAQAAAGGNYGSGGRLAALSKFGSDLNANIYKERFGEAQGADAAKLARQEYLSGLAAKSTAAFSGRLEQLSSIGNASISNQTGISERQAGLKANTTKQAADAYGTLESGALNAESSAAATAAQGDKANRGFIVDIGKTLLGGGLGGGAGAAAAGASGGGNNGGGGYQNPYSYPTGTRDPYDPDGSLHEQTHSVY